MENTKKTFIQSVLYYGAILGIISILISVIIWVGSIIEAAGLWGSVLIGISSIVITFIALLFFTKAFRNKELGGFISFKEAFIFGFFVVLFSAVISGFYNYIFNSYIAPDYSQHIMDVMELKTYNYMVSVGAPESQIDKAMEGFKDVPTAIDSTIQSLKFGIIGGTLIALITSLIVKRKEEKI